MRTQKWQWLDKAHVEKLSSTYFRTEWASLFFSLALCVNIYFSAMIPLNRKLENIINVFIFNVIFSSFFCTGWK